MKVEYSARSLADLSSIAAYYDGFSDPRISERVMARIHEVVARVGFAPESGRRVADRPDVRVVPLLSYPYVIFYRVTDLAAIRIVHIRHTSRRPWSGR